MLNKKIVLALISCICWVSLLHAQPKSVKVLFLGNSYTQVNNLPKLLKDIAISTGDTIITDENTPGGHTLMGHSTNATSLAKIKAAKWDFVVLQEQSQLPSFPEADVRNMVYPNAKLLDSLIGANHACTQTVFYMTWGRKNGDAQNCATWPPVCTYQGMDSLLALRYTKMANDNNALLSPVGALWKYLRTNSPGLELYQSDESHPSLAGSYAAACSFYAVILKKDPTLITYNAGLAAVIAYEIRQAAKLVVYQNLINWNVGKYEPDAVFGYTIANPNQKLIQFENGSTNAISYMWDFGDGDTSTAVNPNHLYKQDGTYNVRLTALGCNTNDTHDTSITLLSTGISNIDSEPISVFPNPTGGRLHYEFPEAFLGLTYRIIDVHGKILQTEQIENTKGMILLETLPSGLYSLEIAHRHHKIIKQ